MLVLLFVALWFILPCHLFYVLPCVILFLCFSVLLVLRLPRLGKRELILVLFLCLFNLCLFGFVSFLFLLVFGKGCGLWLWHTLDFSLTFFLTAWLLQKILQILRDINVSLRWRFRGHQSQKEVMTCVFEGKENPVFYDGHVLVSVVPMNRNNQKLIWWALSATIDNFFHYQLFEFYF